MQFIGTDLPYFSELLRQKLCLSINTMFQLLFFYPVSYRSRHFGVCEIEAILLSLGLLQVPSLEGQ